MYIRTVDITQRSHSQTTVAWQRQLARSYCTGSKFSPMQLNVDVALQTASLYASQI